MKIEKLINKFNDFNNQRVVLNVELTKSILKTKGNASQIKRLLSSANKVGIRVSNSSLALAVMQKNKTLNECSSIDLPIGTFICSECGKIRTKYSYNQKTCTYCK